MVSIRLLLPLLVPVVTALPLGLSQKKCTETCLSDYRNEVPDAPLFYEYQKMDEVNKGQLCNFVNKMVMCNAFCPEEITDEDKAIVARNFALSYLCKKDGDSIDKILGVVSKLPTTAYGNCAKQCQMQDSCEKQTCLTDCLKKEYDVCTEEPCTNLVSAEIFISNFPFESNSKDVEELKQQTEAHMEHVPEPSKCLTSLIAHDEEKPAQDAPKMTEEVEGSGDVEAVQSQMQSSLKSELQDEGSDVTKVLQRIKSITLHIRPLPQKSKLVEGDALISSMKLEEVDGDTMTEAKPIETEQTAVDRLPKMEETATTQAMKVEIMEKKEDMMEGSGSVDGDAKVESSGAAVDSETSLMEKNMENEEMISMVDINELNQADSALKGEQSPAGQKEVVPTGITMEKTTEETEMPDEMTDSTIESSTIEGEMSETSSTPTIIVDDKDDMAETNHIDAAFSQANGASGLVGAIGSLIIALVLLH